MNENQKFLRYEIVCSLILRNQAESFLHQIITCDEKWILYDNRRRTGQWLDKKESPKHFPKPGNYPKKVMITVWWTMEGIVHYEYLTPGKTITAVSYSQQLTLVHQKLLVKQPALVNRKGVILLHDNAKPHISKVTQAKLKELKFEVLPHPPYSPDLVPTDFQFFKHLDNFLTGKIFDDPEALKNEVDAFISSRTKEFYQSGINKLLERWEKCELSNGSYFD